MKHFATKRGDRVSKSGDAHSQMAGIVKEIHPTLKRHFHDMMEMRKRADYEPEGVLASEFNSSIIFHAQTVRTYFTKEAEL